MGSRGIGQDRVVRRPLVCGGEIHGQCGSGLRMCGVGGMKGHERQAEGVLRAVASSAGGDP
eukprot:13801376-Heterocapsa_arctica.AAC.1